MSTGFLAAFSIYMCNCGHSHDSPSSSDAANLFCMDVGDVLYCQPRAKSSTAFICPTNALLTSAAAQPRGSQLYLQTQPRVYLLRLALRYSRPRSPKIYSTRALKLHRTLLTDSAIVLKLHHTKHHHGRRRTLPHIFPIPQLVFYT